MGIALNQPSNLLKKVFRAATDSEVSSRDLGTLIQSVPELPERLKRYIQHYYGYLGGDLDTPTKAAMVLGPRVVLDVAVCHAFVGGLQTEVPRALRVALWSEALRRAVAARLIADRLDDVPVDAAFSAGLALEYGVIPLMTGNNHYIEWARTIRHLGGDARIQAERAAFGKTHVDGLVRLGRQWELPENLLYVVAHHHDPTREHPSAARGICASVRLADRLAEAMNAESTATALEDWVCEIGDELDMDPASAWQIVEETLDKLPDVARVLDVEIERQPTIEQLTREGVSHTDPERMNPEELVEWTRILVEENQSQKSRIEEMTIDRERARLIDPVTGVPNHAGFMVVLGRRIPEAKASRAPMCLVTVDLDDFTELNQHSGYEVGDRVLKAVGATLRKVWREALAMARTGADSFTGLFPCDERTARVIAERSRAAIEAVRLDGDAIRVRVTATITGASLDALNGVRQDHHALMAAAGKAHQAGRAQGGNRTVW